MGVDMTKSPGSNEWGVTDRDIYRHITSTLDSDSPTFSVVMTTSNHRPYSIDLKEAGCEIAAPPPGYELFDDGNASLKMLGHHSYSDLCIGEFVDSFLKKNTPRPSLPSLPIIGGEPFLPLDPPFLNKPSFLWSFFRRDAAFPTSPT
ncbi:MAG: phosphoglycerol transferase MdoB-like AlkP superfamily enzyme [Akkermansiaceae bacterium]|jgi:phosphoglycerol transferase MdoB-like AlkP superfamily enzyme